MTRQAKGAVTSRRRGPANGRSPEKKGGWVPTSTFEPFGPPVAESVRAPSRCCSWSARVSGGRLERSEPSEKFFGDASEATKDSEGVVFRRRASDGATLAAAWRGKREWEVAGRPTVGGEDWMPDERPTLLMYTYCTARTRGWAPALPALKIRRIRGLDRRDPRGK